jgi:hypothetical protein
MHIGDVSAMEVSGCGERSLIERGSSNGVYLWSRRGGKEVPTSFAMSMIVNL